MESQLLLAAPIQTWPLSTLLTRELLTVAPTQTLPRTMLWTSGLMLILPRTTSSTKKRRAWEKSARPSRALLQQRSSQLNEGCLRMIRALLAVSSLASEGERGWREIGRQIGIFTVLYQKTEGDVLFFFVSCFATDLRTVISAGLYSCLAKNLC